MDNSLVPWLGQKIHHLYYVDLPQVTNLVLRIFFYFSICTRTHCCSTRPAWLARTCTYNLTSGSRTSLLGQTSIAIYFYRVSFNILNYLQVWWLSFFLANPFYQNPECLLRSAEIFPRCVVVLAIWVVFIDIIQCHYSWFLSNT